MSKKTFLLQLILGVSYKNLGILNGKKIFMKHKKHGYTTI